MQLKKNHFEDTRSLAYVSLMSGISLALVLIAYFIDGIGLLLVLVLPLCSALVATKVNAKYALIYIIATFLISCIDIQLAVFILIPSLISGLIFGKLIKIYVQGYFIIFLDALTMLLMQIGATELVDFLYAVDLVSALSHLLRLSETTFQDAYFLFLFLLSLMEACLCYLIITNELKKLNMEFNEKKNRFLTVLILESLCIASTGVVLFFSSSFGYLLLGISAYFAVILAYYNFSFYRKKDVLALQIPLYVVSLVAMAALLSRIEKPFQPYLFLLPMISQILVSLEIVFYQKCIKKSKITSALFDKF